MPNPNFFIFLVWLYMMERKYTLQLKTKTEYNYLLFDKFLKQIKIFVNASGCIFFNTPSISFGWSVFSWLYLSRRRQIVKTDIWRGIANIQIFPIFYWAVMMIRIMWVDVYNVLVMMSWFSKVERIKILNNTFGDTKQKLYLLFMYSEILKKAIIFATTNPKAQIDPIKRIILAFIAKNIK